MKTIGFICPLGEEESETRYRSDDIMDNIIMPIADELGYDVCRADKMSGDNIMDDIIEMIKKSDILIADLTEYNPNVFYELGIRQSIKGKCINIVSKSWLNKETNNRGKIPFDITYYRAHEYSCENFRQTEKFRNYIKNRIKNLEKSAFSPYVKLSDEEIITFYNSTLVTDFRKGQKNHYELAKNLFSEPCKTIFLMQRSSSIVLNAELDWSAEAIFVESLKSAMNNCEFFYHIISLEGIESHFNRKNSVFPNFKNFSDNLKNVNGAVYLNTNNQSKRDFALKKLQKDNQNTLFKLDRQARVLITETYSGKITAVIVQNLGPDQTSFQICGSKAKEYLDTCIEFYNSCDYVYWREIQELYHKYQEIERKREE